MPYALRNLKVSPIGLYPSLPPVAGWLAYYLMHCGLAVCERVVYGRQGWELGRDQGQVYMCWRGQRPGTGLFRGTHEGQ